MDKKEWWVITTCEADVEAGYPQVSEIVHGDFDNLDPLGYAVEAIEKKHGVPDYRLNVTSHWIDKDGDHHSEFYGTAEEYLL